MGLFERMGFERPSLPDFNNFSLDRVRDLVDDFDSDYDLDDGSLVNLSSLSDDAFQSAYTDWLNHIVAFYCYELYASCDFFADLGLDAFIEGEPEPDIVWVPDNFGIAISERYEPEYDSMFDDWSFYYLPEDQRYTGESKILDEYYSKQMELNYRFNDALTQFDRNTKDDEGRRIVFVSGNDAGFYNEYMELTQKNFENYILDQEACFSDFSSPENFSAVADDLELLFYRDGRYVPVGYGGLYPIC